MLKLSKLVSYTAFVFLTLTAQFVSAAPTAADRAFLGMTESAYSVGGKLTGLNPGNEIVLFNNNSDQLVLNANGSFEFSHLLAKGSSYKVTVAAQPPGQFCVVGGASGAVGDGNVNTISVRCGSKPYEPSYIIGARVEGLKPGAQLRLANNGTDQIQVQQDGVFRFPRPVAAGDAYNVTVVEQPAGQFCFTIDGAGKANGDMLVEVMCPSPTK
jgi:hypothetical protein